jgi:preprotein translocase subunit SecG
MGFVIGILTFVLVVDCAALILLVLIQLPKKEAGMGLAFGGAATDALFGAGSGNVLTKITKYAAGAFFVLAIVLSLLQSNYHRRTTSGFRELIEKPGGAPPTSLMPPTQTPTTPTTPAVVPVSGSNVLAVPPRVEDTNLPVTPLPPPLAPATNK